MKGCNAFVAIKSISMNKASHFVFFLLLATKIFPQKTALVEPAFPFLKSYPNIRDFTLSASGNEVYFTVQSPLEELGAIACMKKKASRWSAPELVNFTGRWRDIEPFLTQDGLRLYFSSNRPLNDTTKSEKDYDIWYVERKDTHSNWSSPVNLGAPVNSERDEFYPSLALNGNLYFTSERADSKGKDDIYVSKRQGDSYAIPYSVDTTVNTAGYEFNSFISPDDSFLLYTGYARKEGLGSGDLYISFRSSDGYWLPSVSLGEGVNSKQMDYCPFVDTKTGTLYFTSRRSLLPNRSYASLKEFEAAVSQYENGFSRIYKAPFAMLLKKLKKSSVR